MPTVRSPAQIEAARRNGAMSHGPATPEGKARSSQNALKHGLAAAKHLLAEDEDPAEFETLYAGLVKELLPVTELEAALLHRLAAALWKQRRADRMERELLAWAPRPRYIAEGGFVYAPCEVTVDLARFEAVRRYAGQAGREVSRCLRELRLLRKEPLAVVERERDGPEAPAPVASANAPNEPEPAADQAPCLAPSPRHPARPEAERDFSPAERAEIEAMLTSGDPAFLVAGAARAGVLHAVVDVVPRHPGRNAAAG